MADGNESTVTPTDENEQVKPKPVARAPPSDIHFAFGPQTRFWIIVDGQWKFKRAPWLDWRASGIDEPCWVAFRHDDGCYVGGITKKGQAAMASGWKDPDVIPVAEVDSFVTSRDAYKRLQKWILDQLEEDPTRIKELAITIGPGGSYFARYKSSHISHDLPENLQMAIENSKVTPHSVALGVRGAWTVTWSDGTHEYDLCDAYPSLKRTDALVAPAFIALNPFADDQWFVVGQNGHCMFNHYLDREDNQYVHEQTDTYMRMRARRDGTTFAHSTHWSGRPDRITYITPTSNAVETRTDRYMAILRAKQDWVDSKMLIGAGLVAGGSVALARTRAAKMPLMRIAMPVAAMGLGYAASSWRHGAV